jgi:hypothetical protein
VPGFVVSTTPAAPRLLAAHQLAQQGVEYLLVKKHGRRLEAPKAHALNTALARGL